MLLARRTSGTKPGTAATAALLAARAALPLGSRVALPLPLRHTA
jgi:hypothetical protein